MKTKNIIRTYRTLLYGICSLFIVGCSTNNEPVVLPTFSPLIITNITTSSAFCVSAILNNGGAPIEDKGVCWSISTNPTLADNIIPGGIDVDSIGVPITFLTTYTKYYVRMYATNKAGTAFGDVVSFTTQGGTVMDIDGNVYQTISIGTQVWMAENLRTTKYRNGDSISYVIDDNIWAAPWTLPSWGAYSYYNNLISNATIYGAIYNFPATTDLRNLAPEGWHVPTANEWDALISSVEHGGQLKETGTKHWKAPNAGATNASGFTAVPGGLRSFIGGFEDISKYAYFWTSTYYELGGGGYHTNLSYDMSGVSQGAITERYGFSVRCIRD